MSHSNRTGFRRSVVRSLVVALAVTAVGTAVVFGIPAAFGANTRVAWYGARASGVVAYLALAVAAALGVSVATRALDRLMSRPVQTEAHRLLSLIALGFVGLHVAFLLTDQFVHFSLRDVLLPGLSSYRTAWTALGIVAAYGIILTELSFRWRPRIGYQRWRQLHYLTFAVFVLATLHGVFTGTDSATRPLALVYWAAAAAVTALTVLRVLGARGRGGARRVREALTLATDSGAKRLMVAATLVALVLGGGAISAAALRRSGPGTSPASAAVASVPSSGLPSVQQSPFQSQPPGYYDDRGSEHERESDRDRDGQETHDD